MGWLRAVKQRNPQVTELRLLKDELHRVTEELESREGELAEALEQQAATSEILRVIASSPTDIQPCPMRWSRVPRGSVRLQMA
jgi:hypothetical protein